MEVGHFKKRMYRSFGQFWKDLSFLWKEKGKNIRAARRNLILPAFRERLMLEVSVVNGCRYCSYLHAKTALKAGLSPEEIKSFLSGSASASPQEEAVALLYAQHWAESGGEPEPEAVQRLFETYGAEKAETIDGILRMITLGSLMGNTWDYFLHHIPLFKGEGD